MSSSQPLLERDKQHQHGSSMLHSYVNVVATVQLLSVAIFLVGQTTCVFNYEWTAKVGLQESEEEVGPTMVQVGRAFGAADTVIYIPLLLSSMYGLFRRKKWSMLCTAASAGIHMYWSTTILFEFFFLSRNPTADWKYHPPLEIKVFVWFYLLYGILLMAFLHVFWQKMWLEFQS